jgi:hypothetical protein
MTECSATKLGEHYFHEFTFRGRIDAPSGTLGDIHAEKGLLPLTKLRTLGNETKTVKVHVCAAYDGDKFFVGTNKVVLYNVVF